MEGEVEVLQLFVETFTGCVCVGSDVDGNAIHVDSNVFHVDSDALHVDGDAFHDYCHAATGCKPA